MHNQVNNWITTRAAATILVVHPQSVPKIADAAAIRRRTLPGVAVRWYRADVERVLAESIARAPAGPRARKTARPAGRNRGRAAHPV